MRVTAAARPIEMAKRGSRVLVDSVSICMKNKEQEASTDFDMMCMLAASSFRSPVFGELWLGCWCGDQSEVLSMTVSQCR